MKSNQGGCPSQNKIQTTTAIFERTNAEDKPRITTDQIHDIKAYLNNIDANEERCFEPIKVNHALAFLK